MEQTEKLGLWLPGENDPLDITKLNENSQKLDEFAAESSGGDIIQIVNGMQIGDITCSARNLEEESGGVLIACDQRTIDLSAYPDIPRDVLFWPYAELVFSHTDTSFNYNFGIPMTSGANTAEWIYTRGGYYSSYHYDYLFAYSMADKTIKRVNAKTTGTNAYYGALVRLAEDRLLLCSTDKPVFVNNDLTNSSLVIQESYGSALAPKNGAIARIDEDRFFAVVFAATSGVQYGFYTTSNGFLSLNPISMPDGIAASNISSSRFDQAGSAPRAYSMLESPFYPIRRMSNGEMMVTFKGSATYADARSVLAEQSVRDSIKKCIPAVWKTSDNCASIAVDTILGESFVDWVVEQRDTIKTETGMSLGYLQINGTLPLDGRYLLKVGFASSGTGGAKFYYLILLDLETGEYTMSDRYDASGAISDISFGAPENIMYDKFHNRLYYFNDAKTAYALSLDDLTFTTIRFSFGGMGARTSWPNHMPSAVTVSFANRYDKRLRDRGINAVNTEALCVLADGIPKLEFSSPLMAESISYNSKDTGREVLPAIAYPNNFSEYDGDLYLGLPGGLYKIPLKTKRQMPYIERGYMKVLNEEVSE